MYGPSAIQSVAEQVKETPYTELTKDDLRWEVMDTTNVETKVFYLINENGQMGMVQVIYSNVLGVHTTAQFNSKVFSSKPGEGHLWCSDNVKNPEFSEDKFDFKAQGCSMELSEDGKTYHVKSNVNKKSVVDVKITRSAPGFAVGKNGTTTFGKDPKEPWGRMRHGFWPWCQVEGHIITPSGPVNFKGRGMVNHNLQGMKPHFAASKWNFANFQSPSYAAIMMEYTTPPSYSDTVVNVGGITTQNEIIMVGASPSTKAEHTEVKGDPDNDWPEPGAVRFTWQGKTADGKDVSAELQGSLGQRSDRVDVMGEVPKFLKQIVAGASGAKPYIYQYTPRLLLKLNIGGEEKVEEGQLFMEATFIS